MPWEVRNLLNCLAQKQAQLANWKCLPPPAPQLNGSIVFPLTYCRVESWKAGLSCCMPSSSLQMCIIILGFPFFLNTTQFCWKAGRCFINPCVSENEWLEVYSSTQNKHILCLGGDAHFGVFKGKNVQLNNTAIWAGLFEKELEHSPWENGDNHCYRKYNYLTCLGCYSPPCCQVFRRG